jgi:ferritin-like metal-binding protein YciE
MFLLVKATPKGLTFIKIKNMKTSSSTNTKKSSGSNGTAAKTTTSNGSASNGGMQSSQLMKLFEQGLKDIYWAEKALTKAIPKMAKNATSEDLSSALDKHLGETKMHVSRLEQVFEILEKKPIAKKCEAMDGLIREGGEIMQECEEGAMRDAGIISAAQKIEHYEIASYGTLRTFAEVLGLSDAASLLEETLHEEKAADEKLSNVAESAVNVEASQDPGKSSTKRK